MIRLYALSAHGATPARLVVHCWLAKFARLGFGDRKATNEPSDACDDWNMSCLFLGIVHGLSQWLRSHFSFEEDIFIATCSCC
jgi:hypothetical protein